MTLQSKRTPALISKYLGGLIIFGLSCFTQASTLTPSVSGNTATLSWTCTGIFCDLKRGSTLLKRSNNSPDSYSLTLTPGTYTFILETYSAGGISGPSITEARLTNVTIELGVGSISQISAPSSDVDGQFSVSWAEASRARYYVLQQQVSGGTWAEVFRGSEREYAAVVPPATYLYRVQACNSASCSSYQVSGQVKVSGSTASTDRRVIFIHTDLLGSPAAETDELGRESQ